MACLDFNTIGAGVGTGSAAFALTLRVAVFAGVVVLVIFCAVFDITSPVVTTRQDAWAQYHHKPVIRA
jgi:hypothetical protein